MTDPPSSAVILQFVSTRTARSRRRRGRPDGWIELRTDESGLTSLGLVLVTLPLGATTAGVADTLLGAAAEGLKPALPVLLMTGSGLFQAWLLWLTIRGRRAGVRRHTATVSMDR